MKAEWANRPAAMDSNWQQTDIRSAAASDCFDRQWAQQVVRETLLSMEAECSQKGRSDLWEVFRLRFAEPMMNDAEPVEYDQIIRRFRLESPREAMNLLANAKRSFLRHLRIVVGKYVSNDSEIDREIDDLRGIV